METVDIAIAGSGIACTATLIEVFRRLIGENVGRPKLIITVVEKHHEFWTGIPYGSRSSVNALTITSVYDFFTAEKEREQFFAWFKQHKAGLIEFYLLNGGLSARSWLERNGEALEREDFKNVYLPRFMCGRYIQSKFNSLLAIVQERGLAELILITAEVINVMPLNGSYEVTYETADSRQSTFNAARVVIATGSAPVKEINLPPGSDAVLLINNLYEPSANENIDKLAKVLAAVEDEKQRNVLLIGTNASSIELLYLLAGLPRVTASINKLVALSKSGLFPYTIIDKTPDAYTCENLDQLKATGNYNIETLIAAARQDLQPAVQQGVIIPYVDRIIAFTIELLQALDEQAKAGFLGIYGMQLSNLFRRSGMDYKGGEALLLELKKLSMLKGAFEKIEPDNDGSLKLYYLDSDSGEEQVSAIPFKAVINCTGANDLGRSSSRLIRNLVHKGIASVNLSGKGFYVNEKFEAAPKLYVMGPLLGGNMNSRIHFWHLENASRIMYLAPFLADCLLGD